MGGGGVKVVGGDEGWYEGSGLVRGDLREGQATTAQAGRNARAETPGRSAAGEDEAARELVSSGEGAGYGPCLHSVA